MARKTKQKVCEELTEKGIEFNPDANYNVLYKLLEPDTVPKEILTTETIVEREPKVEEVKLSSQFCGRCSFYRFHKERGFLRCTVRGGKRRESDGASCNKFRVKKDE